MPWLVPVFALGIACRDAETLWSLDMWAIIVVLVVAGLRGRCGSPLVAQVSEYPLGIARLGFWSVLGIVPLTQFDIRWAETPTRGQIEGRALAIVRGVALSVPLLLVFGGLFSQADPEFRSLVNRLFVWNFNDLVFRTCWTAFCFVFVAGAFRTMLLADWSTEAPTQPPFWKLGCDEIIVVLTLLNVLFLTFVAIQIRYLFGGAALVHATGGLTYAEYARSGFFELVWVTVLVLPTLLLLDWLKREASPTQLMAFRGLSLSLIALLFVVAASAMRRMELYVAQCGLTELRLYTAIFMAWLAVVFVWYIATVLRGQRDRFAFGAIVTGLVFIAGMHVANPAATIVRVNIERNAAGHPLDVSYITGLGADAVPRLIEGLPSIRNASQRADVAYFMLQDYGAATKGDWRSWNYAQSAAWEIVDRNRAQLSTVARASSLAPKITNKGGR
ncbi:MAG TPA: DUF4173 domain-containing protein [Capsulimonadaceae bacterium]|jgi:hypothetical protein